MPEDRPAFDPLGAPPCHQHLGYLPALADVPDQIRRYLCQQLHLPPTTYTVVEATRTLARYRYLIRTYLAIALYQWGRAGRHRCGAPGRIDHE